MPIFMYIDFKTLKDDLKQLHIFKNTDDDTFVAEHFGKKGTIAFFDPYVEMFIEKDGETIFLLQSEMISRGQIDDYLRAFFEKLFLAEGAEKKIDRVMTDRKLNILFTCTCGATSGLLASGCQEIVNKEGLDVHYNAVPIDDVANVQKDYDAIFYLPQIAYIIKGHKYDFADKVVALDIQDVAKKDCEAITKFSILNTINISTDRAQKALKNN